MIARRDEENFLRRSPQLVTAPGGSQRDGRRRVAPFRLQRHMGLRCPAGLKFSFDQMLMRLIGDDHEVPGLRHRQESLYRLGEQ